PRRSSDLLSQELTLVSGENGHFRLLDGDDNVLVQSQVGQAYDQDGIKLQVEVLQANPGTRFSIVRDPRLTSILKYQKVLDVSERGKESGMIGLALESTVPAEAIQILNEIARLYVRQNVERTSAE